MASLLIAVGLLVLLAFGELRSRLSVRSKAPLRAIRGLLALAAVVVIALQVFYAIEGGPRQLDYWSVNIQPQPSPLMVGLPIRLPRRMQHVIPAMSVAGPKQLKLDPQTSPVKPAPWPKLKTDPSQASIVSLAQQQKAKAEVRAARHRRFLTQKQAHAKARHRRYLREQKAHARARHKRWRAEKRCWGRHGKWIKGACKLPSPPVSSPQASAPTQTYTPPSKQPAPTQTKPANPGPSSGCKDKYCPDPAGPAPPAPKPPGPDKYPGSTGRSASALTGGTDSTLASAGTGGASGPDEG
jgi:hypothetical protein